MVISICFFLIAIVYALALQIAEKFDIADYLNRAGLILFALLIYIIIQDLSILTILNDHDLTQKTALITPLQEPTTSLNIPNNHT